MPTLALTISCYVYFFGYQITLQDVFVIRCTPHFSSGNTYSYRKNFWQLLFVNFIFVLISTIFIPLSKWILIGINIEKKLAISVYLLLLKTYPAKLIDNYIFILKGVLISHSSFGEFYYVIIASLSGMGFSIYLFIVRLGYGLNGFAISLTVKVVIELFSILILIYLKIDKRYIQPVSFKETIANFKSQFIFTISIGGSFYFEYVAYFISFLFIAQTRDNNIITAYAIHVDLNIYPEYVIEGLLAYIESQLLIEIGKENKEEYLRKKKIYLGYLGIIAFLLTLSWALSFEHIAFIFSSKKVIREYVNILNFMNIIEIPLNTFIATNIAFLNIIEKERLQVILSLTVYGILTIAFQGIFVLQLKLDVYGCKLGEIITCIIYIAVLIFFYSRYEKKFLDELEDGELSDEEIEMIQEIDET